MELWLLIQQSELLKIQTEVYGMVAENSQRKYKNEAMAYVEIAFSEKAFEIQSIINTIYENR